MAADDVPAEALRPPAPDADARAAAMRDASRHTTPRSGFTSTRSLWMLGAAIVAIFEWLSWMIGDFQHRGGVAGVLVFLAVAWGACLPVVVPGGLIDGVRAWLADRRRRARGGARWERDRAWDVHGGKTVIVVGGSGALGWLSGFSLLVIAQGAFLVFRRRLASPEFLLASCAVLLVLLVVVPRTLRGRVHAAWPEFPQFLGSVAEYHVGTTTGGARIDGLVVLLRCVRDVPSGPFGWGRRSAVVWAERAALDDDAYIAPETDVRVRFSLPAGAYQTDLVSPEAVAWELLVLGRIGKRRCHAAVLVPVYAPPRE